MSLVPLLGNRCYLSQRCVSTHVSKVHPRTGLECLHETESKNAF